MVFSPPYACHVEVVTKLTAVFIARSGVMGVVRLVLSYQGRKVCNRRRTYKRMVPARLKMMNESAYRFQSISLCGSTPASR